jgi:hypothetical protein
VTSRDALKPWEIVGTWRGNQLETNRAGVSFHNLHVIARHHFSFFLWSACQTTHCLVVTILELFHSQAIQIDARRRAPETDRGRARLWQKGVFCRCVPRVESRRPYWVLIRGPLTLGLNESTSPVCSSKFPAGQFYFHVEIGVRAIL